MRVKGLHIVLVTVLLGTGALTASAQFKQDAFTQTYADTTLTEGKDTTDKLFSFQEFFGGLSHKREARIGTLFAGSTVFIGSYQIYHKQYWKLPIVYGGIGAGVGLGTYYTVKYKNAQGVLREELRTRRLPSGRRGSDFHPDSGTEVREPDED